MELGCGGGDRAIPVRDACPDLLRAGSLALGMVGTANEQAVGHGLPLIVAPGAGDQGKAYVRMKQRWNGPTALHLPRDAQAIADAIRALQPDPARKAAMVEAGTLRMGAAGASKTIALAIRAELAQSRDV